MSTWVNPLPIPPLVCDSDPPPSVTAPIRGALTFGFGYQVDRITSVTTKVEVQVDKASSDPDHILVVVVTAPNTFEASPVAGTWTYDTPAGGATAVSDFFGTNAVILGLSDATGSVVGAGIEVSDGELAVTWTANSASEEDPFNVSIVANVVDKNDFSVVIDSAEVAINSIEVEYTPIEYSEVCTYTVGASKPIDLPGAISVSSASQVVVDFVDQKVYLNGGYTSTHGRVVQLDLDDFGNEQQFFSVTNDFETGTSSSGTDLCVAYAPPPLDTRYAFIVGNLLDLDGYTPYVPGAAIEAYYTTDGETPFGWEYSNNAHSAALMYFFGSVAVTLPDAGVIQVYDLSDPPAPSTTLDFAAEFPGAQPEDVVGVGLMLWASDRVNGKLYKSSQAGLEEFNTPAGEEVRALGVSDGLVYVLLVDEDTSDTIIRRFDPDTWTGTWDSWSATVLYTDRVPVGITPTSSAQNLQFTGSEIWLPTSDPDTDDCYITRISKDSGDTIGEIELPTLAPPFAFGLHSLGASSAPTIVLFDSYGVRSLVPSCADESAIYLDVDADCNRAGFSIVVAFSDEVPTDATWTLYRVDASGETVVRGARDVSVGATSILSVVDYETPVTVGVQYKVVVMQSGTTLFEETVSKSALSTVCGETQYLRDLLDPEVYFTSSFCLGTIEQTESQVNSGIFNALGRAAPIVVVDTRETETGTLRFISRTQEELDELRRLFTRGTPMLLQIDDEYNLGRYGVVYFQPTKFTDRWLAPNAKLPYHQIEVGYTTIDAPSYGTVFERFGIPYDAPITAAPGFTITDGDLAGRAYCDGGVKQRYASYNTLLASGLTYTDLYYLPDSCAG